MAMAVEITMVIALVLSIIVPGVSFLKGQRTKSRFKSHLAVNVVTFFGLLIVATVSILAGNTSALAATASSGSGFATGMGYIAAALSVGISCIGGAEVGGRVQIGSTGQYIDYGHFISTVINFLIMALCIFLMIKAVNKLMTMGKKKAEEEAAAEPPKEEVLLTEIRDLLKAQAEAQNKKE